MARIQKNNSSYIQYTYFRHGVITAIQTEANTATVQLEPEGEGEPSVILESIPIFFHCDDNVQELPNGALEGAAAAFDVGDKVAVVFSNDEQTAKIVANLTAKRGCGKPIWIVYGSYLYNMRIEGSPPQLRIISYFPFEIEPNEYGTTEFLISVKQPNTLAGFVCVETEDLEGRRWLRVYKTYRRDEQIIGELVVTFQSPKLDQYPIERDTWKCMGSADRLSLYIANAMDFAYNDKRFYLYKITTDEAGNVLPNGDMPYTLVKSVSYGGGHIVLLGVSSDGEMLIGKYTYADFVADLNIGDEYCAYSHTRVFVSNWELTSIYIHGGPRNGTTYTHAANNEFFFVLFDNDGKAYINKKLYNFQQVGLTSGTVTVSYEAVTDEPSNPLYALDNFFINDEVMVQHDVSLGGNATISRTSINKSLQDLEPTVFVSAMVSNGESHGAYTDSGLDNYPSYFEEGCVYPYKIYPFEYDVPQDYSGTSTSITNYDVGAINDFGSYEVIHTHTRESASQSWTVDDCCGSNDDACYACSFCLFVDISFNSECDEETENQYQCACHWESSTGDPSYSGDLVMLKNIAKDKEKELLCLGLENDIKVLWFSPQDSNNIYDITEDFLNKAQALTPDNTGSTVVFGGF